MGVRAEEQKMSGKKFLCVEEEKRGEGRGKVVASVGAEKQKLRESRKREKRARMTWDGGSLTMDLQRKGRVV